MLGVDNKVVAIGQLAIESHAGLHGGHILHSAHELVLCNHNWLSVGGESLECDKEVGLVDCRNLRAEERGEFVALQWGEVGDLGIGLADEVVDNVGVDTHKLCFSSFCSSMPIK